MSKRAFTLLELIIVIIIIGILAVVGFTQYSKTMEKARWAEAKEIIGSIRKAQWAYYYEHNRFANNLAALDMISAPAYTGSACPAKTHWFSYYVEGYGFYYYAAAFRCTANGKAPDWKTEYYLYLYEDNAGDYLWDEWGF